MHMFFAFLDRMKFIRRWGLMRNTVPENDMEHSMQTAFIAHGLAVLGKTRYHREVDPERAVALAIYHDASEVITGDMPTPVKGMNPTLHQAYADVEEGAREHLLTMLPEAMRADFRPYVKPDQSSLEWQLMKAADRISAYLKCVEEEKMGNRDFAVAKQTIEESIRKSPLPEVADFMQEFVPAFSLSPDELAR